MFFLLYTEEDIYRVEFSTELNHKPYIIKAEGENKIDIEKRFAS